MCFRLIVTLNARMESAVQKSEVFRLKLTLSEQRDQIKKMKLQDNTTTETIESILS